MKHFGVIFDSDGVVVDSETISGEAYLQAFHQMDVPVDQSDLEDAIGRTVETAVARVSEKYGKPVDCAEYVGLRTPIYEALARERGIRAFPGVGRLLDALDESGVPHALASSGALWKIRLNLELAGLEGRFPLIVHGGEVRHGKPDPEAFHLAASRLALRPAQCVVIEDSTFGVEAAARAGMPCLAVSNTFKAERLSGAARVVSSLESIGVSDLRKMADGAAQV